MRHFVLSRHFVLTLAKSLTPPHHSLLGTTQHIPEEYLEPSQISINSR